MQYVGLVQQLGSCLVARADIVSMVYSRSDSGLLIAEKSGSSDERAIARALKDYDRDLRLLPCVVNGTQAWKVYRYAGSDRPAEFLFMWGNDYGEPWPLSFRILDKVRELDKNTTFKARNEDALERDRRASDAKREQDAIEALTDDWMTREGRSALLPRGQSLRRARARTGYHNK